MQTASESMSTEDHEHWRGVWSELFDEVFDFKKAVEQTFRTAFFKGRKNNEPVREYRRWAPLLPTNLSSARCIWRTEAR
jgi:hypothetical protein